MSKAADEVGFEDHDPRRSSIDKPPILSDRDVADMDDDDPSTVFDRLPEEIIQQ